MPTERIPLAQPIDTRDGSLSKDARTTNYVFEKQPDGKYAVLKRPGLVNAVQITPVTPPASLPSQGLTAFGSFLYAVINNVLYSISPLTYAVNSVGTITGSPNAQVYFSRTFLDDYLVFHNGTNLYTYVSLGGLTNNVNGINTVTVTNAGANYSTGMYLTLSGGGGGSGASLTPTVDPASGNITAVKINTPGSGYNVAPTVVINLPPNATLGATGNIGEYTITVSAGVGTPYLGMTVSGTGIAVGAKLLAINGYVFTLSLANTGAVSGSATFTDAGVGGVITTTVQTFYPTGPFVPGIVFLDNYIFVGISTANTTDGNRIYNSTQFNPLDWSNLTYITFEQTADTLVAIVKHLNYLVAFGEFTTQFYYDNGNPPPSSPLDVAESYTCEVGCACGSSVASTDNTVLWIGKSKIFGKSVYLMEGVSPVKVSTNSVDKCIEADDLSQVTAYTYKFSGHTLYILNLHKTHTTLVFDLNEKQWYQWTQYSMQSTDEPNAGTFQESYFRPTFYTEVNSAAYALDDDTATLYKFDTGTYQDDGQAIYCRTVTSLADSGSTKRKFFGRLEIVGDKIANGTMQIRHTGDDYSSWSSYRTVKLDAKRPQIYLSGSDRRRAWEFLSTSNVPLRLEAAEIDFRLGELNGSQE